MKTKILKRLIAIENELIKTENPNTIFIFYDWDKNQFCVREDYNTKNPKENMKTGWYSKKIFFNHYKEYIFAETTHAQVLLDLIGSPVNGNLYTFHTDEIRKDCKFGPNTAFSICYSGENKETKQPESIFEITLHERKIMT